LALTLAREAEARERVAQEAQKAAGAFPVLSVQGITPSPAPPPIVAPQAHKVLSLNSKTKMVTVSSYSPGSSRPVSRGHEETEAEDEPVRVPQPLGADVVYAKRLVSKERPWENFRGERATYIPLARVDDGTQEKMKGEQRSRRRRGKGEAIAPETENKGPNISEIERVCNAVPLFVPVQPT